MKTVCSGINKDKAINIVKQLPEVRNYLSTGDRIEKNLASRAAVAVDSETTLLYKVHVYSDERYTNESKMGHAATFNWYTLDRCTGKVKCSFVLYGNTGSFIRASNAREYPCD